MPTKTTTTPEAIDDELATLDAAAVTAQAERDRVAGRAAAVREAGEAGRRAAILTELRHRYATVPKAAREARTAAHAELMAIASAPELDFDELRAAFIRRQERDQECATGIAFALDQVDPLPPYGPLRAARSRPPASVPMYADERWSDFIDATIQRRAAAAAAQTARVRADELEQIAAAAEQKVREQAARTADGRLAVDQPETLLERFQRITDERVTPEVVAADLEAKPDGTDAKARGVILRERVLAALMAEELEHQDDAGA